MEMILKNIFITIFILLAIVILVLVIALILILFSNFKYNFFISNSTTNIYIKISINYLMGLLKFDAIYTNKLYVKLTICHNFSKYIPFLKNKEKDIEDVKETKEDNNITNDSLNSTNEADFKPLQIKNIDEDLVDDKEVYFDFDKLDIDISEDFKKQEREYIASFNKNTSPDISKGIREKYAYYRTKFNLKKEKVFEFIQSLFSKEAFTDYKKIKNEIIKILNVVKPKEAYANIIIGIEDTYYLAKILVVLSFFYANYKNFNVVPMYNENVFKGYVKLIGDFKFISLIGPLYSLYKINIVKKIIHKLGGNHGRKK